MTSPQITQAESMSLNEIESMFGMTRPTLLRKLNRCGIEKFKVGRKNHVLVSDLKAATLPVFDFEEVEENAS